MDVELGKIHAEKAGDAVTASSTASPVCSSTRDASMAEFARWMLAIGALTTLVGDSTNSAGGISFGILPMLTPIGGLGDFFASIYIFEGDSDAQQTKRTFAVVGGILLSLASCAFVGLAFGLQRLRGDGKPRAVQVWDDLAAAACAGAAVIAVQMASLESFFPSAKDTTAICNLQDGDCSSPAAWIQWSALAAVLGYALYSKSESMNTRVRSAAVLLYALPFFFRALQMCFFENRTPLKVIGWLLAIATIATATVLRRVAAFPLIACFASLVSSFEDFYSAAGIEKDAFEIFRGSLLLTGLFTLVSCASLIALCTFLALGGSANRNKAYAAAFCALAAQTAARAVRSAGGGRISQTLFFKTGDVAAGNYDTAFVYGASFYCSDAYFSEGCPYYVSASAFAALASALFLIAAVAVAKTSSETAQPMQWIDRVARAGLAMHAASLGTVLLYDNRITCVVWIANFFVVSVAGILCLVPLLPPRCRLNFKI